MTDKNRFFRPIAGLLALIAALAVCGYILCQKIDSLLAEHLSQRFAVQTETVARAIAAAQDPQKLLAEYNTVNEGAASYCIVDEKGEPAKDANGRPFPAPSEKTDKDIITARSSFVLNGKMHYLVGSAPAAVMSEKISDAAVLVLIAFTVLSFIVTIGMIYAYVFEEKSRHSDELREAITAAKSASTAKSDFLANMSHEIRTPINAIMGMNEMILREGREPAVREYALNIESASKALLSLVNDILDFSKVEAGKMDIVPGNYRLGHLLTEIVTMIYIKAEQKQLGFTINIDEKLPDQLEGDSVRIRQIIINLLTNAVKYTNTGGVTLNISGFKKSENSEMTIFKFAVSDTGIGIKPEDLKNLFKNFVRLDLNRNRTVEGTGLGLALTQKLAVAMGGSIDVDSVYGVGSTFTFSVPQKVVGSQKVGNFQAKYKAAAQQQHEKYTARFTAPEATLLAVDDSEVNLMVAKGLLKETQIQVTTANSGEKALELMARQVFDIVLLDHMMPGISGIETLERARLLPGYAKIPVIALTANAIVGMREMYLSKGFDDYLAKPVDGDLLEETLQKYLPPEKIKTQYNPADAVPDSNAGAVLPPSFPANAADALASVSSPLDNFTSAADALAAFSSPLDDLAKQPPQESPIKADNLPAAGLNPYIKQGQMNLPSAKAEPATAQKQAAPSALLDKSQPDAEGLSVFNLERGYKNCGNKQDMYHRVLAAFLEEAPRTKATISETSVKKDWEQFTVAVHALKSSALLIGGEKLSRLAKTMEMCGRKIQNLPADNPPADPENFVENNRDLLMHVFDDTLNKAKEYLNSCPPR